MRKAQDIILSLPNVLHFQGFRTQLETVDQKELHSYIWVVHYRSWDKIQFLAWNWTVQNLNPNSHSNLFASYPSTTSLESKY